MDLLGAVQLLISAMDGDADGATRKWTCEQPRQVAPRAAASIALAKSGVISRSSPERDQNRGIQKPPASRPLPPAVRNPFSPRNKMVFRRLGRRPFSV